MKEKLFNNLGKKNLKNLKMRKQIWIKFRD